MKNKQQRPEFVRTLTLFTSWLGVVTLPFSPTLGIAKTTPQTQIHVTLLGQPCLLQGPFDEATLRTIHGIGPAQLYPTLSGNGTEEEKKDLKKAFDKIKSVKSLPSLLDRYQEKLQKRLEAQMAFLEAVGPINKSNPSAALQKAAKKYLPATKLKDFQNLLNKIISSQSKTKVSQNQDSRDSIDHLFDTYNEGIEPDPEGDFHRAIKKLNIQYKCSFEETGESEED